jgi:acyl dehydratase
VSDEQLVGPDALAMIGETIADAIGTVVKKEFQRWAASVGDRNPLYFDDSAAQAAGYREVITPPMYLQHVALGVADLDTLRPDGMPGGGNSAAIPLPKCPKFMAGGEEWSFSAPVYAGDTLRATRTVVDVEQKHGRSGAFVLLSFVNSYVRERDQKTVAEARTSTIARP